MSIKERVHQELTELKKRAAEAEFQARLAKAEATSELRKVWMEAEQNIAKLEARLEDLSGDADDAVDTLLEKVKDNWAKVKGLL
jgi:DNA repair exonuclease SbcCD ATPase subunit